MHHTERDWFVDPDNHKDRYPIEPGEKHMPILFANIHEWLLRDQNRQRQINHLKRYFGSSYSGNLFEYFAARSEPKVFTPWDILAVESLSVSVPPATAKWLLEPDEVRDSYLEIANKHFGDPETTLWGCDQALIGDESEMSKLYALLRLQPGLGYVTTSKLMAAKFPRIVPIRDSQVELLLGLQNEKSWWSTFRTLFKKPRQVWPSILMGCPYRMGLGRSPHFAV